MVDAPEGFEPIYRPWRNGRKVGRTLYAMVGELPSEDDVLIGVLDTRELAWEVVIAHNNAGGWTPDERRKEASP